MFTVLALVLGELLVLTGLWFAWWPLALIVAGAQVVAWALLVDQSKATVVER